MASAAATERGAARRPVIREAMRRAHRAGLPLGVMALAGIAARDHDVPGLAPIVVHLGPDVTLLFWRP
jgi:hypothetical protein